MKLILSFAFSLFLTVVCGTALAHESTYYVVRHAEKQTGSDPLLTAEGMRRAARIATILENRNVRGVYSTSYRRTIATAIPTAAQAGLALRLYKTEDPAALAEELKRQSGTYLIVAHSNTAPSIAAALSGQTVPPLSEDQYDKIYIIRIKDGKAELHISNSDPLQEQSMLINR